jgi:hypothetical protein
MSPKDQATELLHRMTQEIGELGAGLRPPVVPVSQTDGTYSRVRMEPSTESVPGTSALDSINFPMTVQGQIDFRRLSTDIGGGGPPVRVVTTNGPLSVRQE